MICHFALIIALLCLEPSRVDSMYFGNVLRDTVGHNPLFEAQNIEHVGLMSEQASQKIHESYLKSDKRLILLGDDGTIKPSMSENSAYDQWRIKRALKKLSEDSKNEVWIVTDKDVGVLEKDYGRIRGLHLAGYKGTQLGRKSALGMILPQPGPITELRDEANRIATSLSIIIHIPHVVVCFLMRVFSPHFQKISESLVNPSHKMIISSSTLFPWRIHRRRRPGI